MPFDEDEDSLDARADAFIAKSAGREDVPTLEEFTMTEPVKATALRKLFTVPKNRFSLQAVLHGGRTGATIREIVDFVNTVFPQPLTPMTADYAKQTMTLWRDAGAVEESIRHGIPRSYALTTIGWALIDLEMSDWVADRPWKEVCVVPRESPIVEEEPEGGYGIKAAQALAPAPSAKRKLSAAEREEEVTVTDDELREILGG